MTEPLSGAFSSSEYAEKARWRIEHHVARGGMGDVWKAVDQQLGRPVAIKRAIPTVVDAQARLQREARLAGRLNHPAVMTVLDAGVDADGYRIITPWLDGGKLSSLMSNPAVALRAILDVAEGLAHAHAQGIVHRDVKPSNILLHEGRACLIDWGLARDLNEGAPSEGSLTRTGVGVGTPGYMAPEQALGAAVDARADVWSLGTLLLECLTGQTPPPPEVVLSGVELKLPPGTVGDLARSCLLRDPNRRPAHAGVVADRLRGALTPEPPSTRRWPLAMVSVGLAAVAVVALATRTSTTLPDPVGDAARDAVAELAWVALDDSQDVRFAQLRDLASDLVQGLVQRGLSAVPTLDLTATHVMDVPDCANAEINPSATRLLCLGQQTRWIDLTTGSLIWERAFPDVVAGHAYADHAVLSVGDGVLRVSEDGVPARIEEMDRLLWFAFHEPHFLGSIGDWVGVGEPNGSVRATIPMRPSGNAVFDEARGKWVLAPESGQLVLIDPTTGEVEAVAGATYEQANRAILTLDDVFVLVGMWGEVVTLERSDLSVRRRTLYPDVGLVDDVAAGDAYIAFASSAAGVLVYDRRSEGLLGQVQETPASLAVMGSDLLLVDDTVRRVSVAGEPRMWRADSGSFTAVHWGPDGLVAGDSEPLLYDLSGTRRATPLTERTVKDLATVQGGVVPTGVSGPLRVRTEGVWSPLEPAEVRAGRRLFALADGWTMAMPWSGGPDVFRGSERVSSVLRPNTTFVSSAPSGDGRRVGLVSDTGDVYELSVPSGGEPRLRKLSEQAGASQAIPASGPGMLVLSANTVVRLDDAGVQQDEWPIAEGVSGVLQVGDVCLYGTRSGDLHSQVCDTGQAIAVLHGHHGPIPRMAYREDTGDVYTASWDGTLRRWKAAPLLEH